MLHWMANWIRPKPDCSRANWIRPKPDRSRANWIRPKPDHSRANWIRPKPDHSCVDPLDLIVNIVLFQFSNLCSFEL